MNANIIEDLPFSVDKRALCARLKIDEALQEDFDPIYEEAMAVARPRMLYGVAEVSLGEGKAVRVGEALFQSKVLKVNLKGVKRAYPYVATCGRELHELAQTKSDTLERYWVECIAEEALRAGLTAGLVRVRENEGTDTLYAMNPGSLPDWPISQQRPLFSLLGDVMGRIGVELTESFLMLPVKSVSGLLFEATEHYANCSLCPRDGCVGRRAPFDPVLFNEKYHLNEDE